MENISLYYLAIINIITFLAYALDKLKARHGLWRIPEATLLLLAAMGGSVGAFFAMQLFRHKTRHIKFKYGVPLIFILQLAVLIYLVGVKP